MNFRWVEWVDSAIGYQLRVDSDDRLPRFCVCLPQRNLLPFRSLNFSLFKHLDVFRSKSTDSIGIWTLLCMYSNRSHDSGHNVDIIFGFEYFPLMRRLRLGWLRVASLMIREALIDALGFWATLRYFRTSTDIRFKTWFLCIYLDTLTLNVLYGKTWIANVTIKLFKKMCHTCFKRTFYVIGKLI